MVYTRRSILVGLSGLLAAPAIVRASSLMPVRAFAFADVEFDKHLAAAIQYRNEFIDVFERNATCLRAVSTKEVVIRGKMPEFVVL